VPLFGSVYDLRASGNTVVMALGINGAQHVGL
jgi:hypothetical protein